MLVYSEKRYIPTDFNIMVMQDDMQNYIYIHRILYDSAVVLADHYNNDYRKLAEDISPTETLPIDRDDVTFFFEHTPDPIRILAPFLLLCQGKFNSLYDMAGAIHVMSNTFNLRKLPSIPKEVRLNAMSFSMLITEEYSLSWNLFLKQCIPYSEDLLLNRNTAYVPAPTQTNTPTVVATTEPEPAPEPEVEEDRTWLTMPDGSKVELNLDLDVFNNISDTLDFGDGSSSEEAEEEEVVETAPTPAPEKKSGLDFLRAMH